MNWHTHITQLTQEAQLTHTNPHTHTHANTGTLSLSHNSSVKAAMVTSAKPNSQLCLPLPPSFFFRRVLRKDSLIFPTICCLTTFVDLKQWKTTFVFLFRWPAKDGKYVYHWYIPMGMFFGGVCGVTIFLCPQRYHRYTRCWVSRVGKTWQRVDPALPNSR